MSLMDLIHRAWKHACDTLTSHDHITRPPDVDVLFMQELGKLDVEISHIVAMIYSSYTGKKSALDVKIDDYDKLQDQCIGYQEERNKLKTENMTIIAKGTKTINECHVQIEALESSLNTSRFFIFMSGMCGFVLGLACLYLVV